MHPSPTQFTYGHRSVLMAYSLPDSEFGTCHDPPGARSPFACSGCYSLQCCVLLSSFRPYLIPGCHGKPCKGVCDTDFISDCISPCFSASVHALTQTWFLRRSYPPFIAHTGSCARLESSFRLQLSLLRKVFAGCCQSLLGAGPSRRYLRNPCTGARSGNVSFADCVILLTPSPCDRRYRLRVL